MTARVESDATAGAAANSTLPQVAGAAGPPPISSDPDEQFGGNGLPSDHPQWMKDTLSVSQRARALLAKLKPVVMHVVAYWDHRIRSIAIGNARVSVDHSGSYRLD